MNARSNTFELNCQENQACEAVSALIHSIIFYRCYGKFQYKHEGSYSIGTLGFEEVSCDFIDFSYIRCASPKLTADVNREINEFVEKMRQNTPEINGSISLEFYHRRRGRWPFVENTLVWEIWNIKVNCDNNKDERKERIEDVLLEKLITIIQIINNSKCYLPQMPNKQHADTIFDTNYPDAQPYLFKISYSIANVQMTSAIAIPEIGPSFAFRKIIKETLSM